MSRRRKSKDGGQTPPPYIDPAKDSEFLSLSPKRQTIIIDTLDWMLDMDSYASPHHRAAYIAEHYKGTETEGKKHTGLSAKNIYRRYRDWVNAGRDWRILDKYRTLHAPEASPLEKYNLTKSSAAEYFARHNLTQEEWAKKHNWSTKSVSRALSDTGQTAKKQQILDTLAAELRAEPGFWHRQIKTMQGEVDQVVKKLKKLEKQIPPWV